MLTVGGAGASFYLTNQTQSQNFLNSIYSIYSQLGGFDGIDWDIETNSMIELDPARLDWPATQGTLWPGLPYYLGGRRPKLDHQRTSRGYRNG